MTNAEARFNNSLHPQKPEGSLGWTARMSTSTLTQLLNYDNTNHIMHSSSLYTIKLDGVEIENQIPQALACSNIRKIISFTRNIVTCTRTILWWLFTVKHHYPRVLRLESCGTLPQELGAAGKVGGWGGRLTVCAETPGSEKIN